MILQQDCNYYRRKIIRYNPTVYEDPVLLGTFDQGQSLDEILPIARKLDTNGFFDSTFKAISSYETRVTKEQILRLNPLLVNLGRVTCGVPHSTPFESTRGNLLGKISYFELQNDRKTIVKKLRAKKHYYVPREKLAIAYDILNSLLPEVKV